MTWWQNEPMNQQPWNKHNLSELLRSPNQKGKCKHWYSCHSSSDIARRVNMNLNARINNIKIQLSTNCMPDSWEEHVPLWRHQMEIFSTLLALCAGNSSVNSPHKGQWRGALMFSLMCVWTNSWSNNGYAGDLRRHHVHYEVTVILLRVSAILEVLQTAQYISLDNWTRQLLSHSSVSIIPVLCKKLTIIYL